MVTFVCEYCDATLKKNQCDKHVNGRCRPAALICIDCSKTFRGVEYKSHTSCISEMDKHWGQYAPSKQKNNNEHNNKNGNANNNKQNEKEENTKKQQNEQNISGNWKGWKNEIKQALVEESGQQKKVQLQNLKQKVLKRYHEEYEATDKDQQVFLQKLKKLKKVKLTTYVTLG